ncbi:MAG: UdgX family uracil-DNA binding protein [Bryobacterales bacterium]|nr:UdgX family uracil-DNA binding protein [Bryobacterales bacterium]
MRVVRVEGFEDWRREARALLAAEVRPEQVSFQPSEASQDSLFEEDGPSAAMGETQTARITVPRGFLDLAETVALHREERRWDLLYRVLWRVNHSERHLLAVDVDEDVRELLLMEKAVRRDIHKMHAFVRFRKVADEEGERYVAWHRPDHRIVFAVGPWFARRFGAMRWSILTPDGSVHWDTRELTHGPPVTQSEAPQGDDMEELWRSYYASIFNPARVKVKAMKAEMPVRHWATLPEADIIPQLLQQASQREVQMRETQKTSAAPFVPGDHRLEVLAPAVQRCQGCELYQFATQAVFGEGARQALVMFVGEQPGDVEDVKGRPFVGPAGKVLDEALAEAGIDRREVYVTNAVKHFKFEERGKRRIHKTPRGVEVAACKPWLEAEMDAVQPKLIVALGATAAVSLMGRDFRITRDRGVFFPHPRAEALLATVHPSYLLRLPDPQQKAEEYVKFVEDLRLVAERVRELGVAR